MVTLQHLFHPLPHIHRDRSPSLRQEAVYWQGDTCCGCLALELPWLLLTPVLPFHFISADVHHDLGLA